MTQIPGKTQRKSQFDPKNFFSVCPMPPLPHMSYAAITPYVLCRHYPICPMPPLLHMSYAAITPYVLCRHYSICPMPPLLDMSYAAITRYVLCRHYSICPVPPLQNMSYAAMLSHISWYAYTPLPSCQLVWSKFNESGSLSMSVSLIVGKRHNTLLHKRCANSAAFGKVKDKRL